MIEFNRTEGFPRCEPDGFMAVNGIHPLRPFGFD
jgi:hypothetical protein